MHTPPHLEEVTKVEQRGSTTSASSTITVARKEQYHKGIVDANEFQYSSSIIIGVEKIRIFYVPILRELQRQVVTLIYFSTTLGFFHSLCNLYPSPFRHALELLLPKKHAPSIHLEFVWRTFNGPSCGSFA
jgi:hypothetical protein